MRPFQLIRAAAAIFGLILLAACTISSSHLLVADAEAVTPLPDHFLFYTYESAPDGYRRTGDGPMSFSRQGKTYVVTDPSGKDAQMIVRFVPLSRGYLLAANGMKDDPDSTLYGFMSYADGVMSLEITPNDETVAALKQARIDATPSTAKALDDITVSSADEIGLKTRADLDQLIDLYIAGKLPLGDRLVGEVVTAPDAAPASRIVPTAGGWVKVP